MISNVLPHVQEGRIVALMVSEDRRLPVGNVPTARIAGLPGLDLLAWSGLAGPAGLPEPVAAVLNRQVNEAIATEEGRELLNRKRGNGNLRKMLVHGARAALRMLSNTDTAIGRWLRGLLRRAHRNTVVVALAAKLARVACAVLRGGRGFGVGAAMTP